MKVTDKQILEAIKEYRKQPLVRGRHGPPSFQHLAEYLQITERTEQLLSRATLSLRCGDLVERGLLAGTAMWICPECSAINYSSTKFPIVVCDACHETYNADNLNPAVYAFSLQLTEAGQEYLENGHGQDQ
jgi:DNA-binding transcriptional LysR family regulator